MKLDEKRLAYVKWPSGKVTVELISLGKNGCGFHLNNEFFSKSIQYNPLFGSDIGTEDSNGNKVLMSLFSREAPRWLDNDTLEISREAEHHYQNWLHKTTL